MGDELRSVTLVGSGTGSATYDKQSTFTNESSKLLHIVFVDESHTVAGQGTGDSAMFELSKSPASASIVDGDHSFRITTRLRSRAGTSQTDATSDFNGNSRWDDGEFTLEPNESVYVNITATSDNTYAYQYNIQYHYDSD